MPEDEEDDEDGAASSSDEDEDDSGFNLACSRRNADGLFAPAGCLTVLSTANTVDVELLVLTDRDDETVDELELDEANEDEEAVEMVGDSSWLRSACVNRSFWSISRAKSPNEQVFCLTGAGALAPFFAVCSTLLYLSTRRVVHLVDGSTIARLAATGCLCIVFVVACCDLLLLCDVAAVVVAIGIAETLSPLWRALRPSISLPWLESNIDTRCTVCRNLCVPFLSRKHNSFSLAACYFSWLRVTRKCVRCDHELCLCATDKFATSMELDHS